MADHDCLGFSDRPEGLRWTFIGPEGEVSVDVKSLYNINNAFGIRYVALAWLQNRRMTPKLRAFIDYMIEVYG